MITACIIVQSQIPTKDLPNENTIVIQPKKRFYDGKFQTKNKLMFLVAYVWNPSRPL